MSIWCSGPSIGEDDHDNFDGSVVSYINGWSNHYPGYFPERDGGYRREPGQETPASVDVAHAPPWCVPGHEGTGLDESDAVAPWLRLDVYKRTVSVWGGYEAAVSEPDAHSVCLNEDAARKLRDRLTWWLEKPKLQPKAGA